MYKFLTNPRWLALDKQADKLELELMELRAGDWKGVKYLRELNEGEKQQARELRRKLSAIDQEQRKIEQILG